MAVNNGVVTLSGTAADPASRALAGNDAGSVPGVKTVVNNLTVLPQTASATTPDIRPARQRHPAPPPPPKHESRPALTPRPQTTATASGRHPRLSATSAGLDTGSRTSAAPATGGAHRYSCSREP